MQADLEIKNLESLDEESPKPSQDKDDEDLIENAHSLKDMDSGDVLAYSGEISGEFKPSEPTTKALKETKPPKIKILP